VPIGELHCWLHIGTQKTGTTSLQNFLSANREQLLKQGFLYPSSPGDVNHVGMTAYSRDEDKIDLIRKRCGIESSAEVRAYRRRLGQELSDEIEECRPSAVILSNEHLSARVRTPIEIRRVEQLCRSFADRVTIVVYLRNQIDYLVSWYNTLVKSGNSRPFDGLGVRRIERQVDYARMLAPWSRLFGVENMRVRRFEAQDMKGGDILADFASVVGFETKGLARADRLNQSLDAEGVEFLRRFNSHFPRIKGERGNPERAGVVDFLLAQRGGEGFRISRVKAAEIEEGFRESNREVSEKYFGSRHDPLFPPSSCVRPDDEQGDILSVDACIRICAALWREQQLKITQRAPRRQRVAQDGDDLDSDESLLT
jgi:hypothetical protein